MIIEKTNETLTIDVSSLFESVNTLNVRVAGFDASGNAVLSKAYIDASLLQYTLNSSANTAIRPMATNASVGIAIAPFATNASVGLILTTVNGSLNLLATNASVGTALTAYTTNASANLAFTTVNASIGLVATNASVGLVVTTVNASLGLTATNASVNTTLLQYTTNASANTAFSAYSTNSSIGSSSLIRFVSGAGSTTGLKDASYGVNTLLYKYDTSIFYLKVATNTWVQWSGIFYSLG